MCYDIVSKWRGNNADSAAAVAGHGQVPGRHRRCVTTIAVSAPWLAVQGCGGCYGFAEVPSRIAILVCLPDFDRGGNAMRRLIWLALVSSLAGCGGDKPATTLSVTCTGGTQLVGAASIDVLGDLANGLPTMNFPDPANPGKTGNISVQPHDRCKITPGNPSNG